MTSLWMVCGTCTQVTVQAFGSLVFQIRALRILYEDHNGRFVYFTEIPLMWIGVKHCIVRISVN